MELFSGSLMQLNYVKTLSEGARGKLIYTLKPCEVCY